MGGGGASRRYRSIHRRGVAVDGQGARGRGGSIGGRGGSIGRAGVGCSDRRVHGCRVAIDCECAGRAVAGVGGVGAAGAG